MMHARCLVPRAFQLTKHKPSDWAPVRLSFLASHSDHNEKGKKNEGGARFLRIFFHSNTILVERTESPSRPCTLCSILSSDVPSYTSSNIHKCQKAFPSFPRQRCRVAVPKLQSGCPSTRSEILEETDTETYTSMITCTSMRWFG